MNGITAAEGVLPNGRCRVLDRDRCVLRSLGGLRARAGSEGVMSTEYLLGLSVAVLVTVYLVYALLRPERF